MSKHKPGLQPCSSHLRPPIQITAARMSHYASDAGLHGVMRTNICSPPHLKHELAQALPLVPPKEVRLRQQNAALLAALPPNLHAWAARQGQHEAGGCMGPRRQVLALALVAGRQVHRRPGWAGSCNIANSKLATCMYTAACLASQWHAPSCHRTRSYRMWSKQPSSTSQSAIVPCTIGCTVRPPAAAAAPSAAPASTPPLAAAGSRTVASVAAIWRWRSQACVAQESAA